MNPKYKYTPDWKLVDMMNCADTMKHREDVSEESREKAAEIAKEIELELVDRGL